MSAEVENEVSDGVRMIAMNRPEVRNALTRSVVAELTDAFRDAVGDRATRAIILTGRGGAFSSGLDLKSAAADPLGQGTPADGIDLFHGLIRAVAKCPQPVVGLVDGPAVGFGCNLALACTMRVATQRAYFQEKFVRIGLHPDGGGTYWLVRHVGLAKAAELVMLGDKLDAEEALRLGVVNRCVPTEQGPAVAWELANRLAKGPSLALRLMKESIEHNSACGLDAALEQEKRAQLLCLQSADFVEGVTAFLQKREPSFRGEG